MGKSRCIWMVFPLHMINTSSFYVDLEKKKVLFSPFCRLGIGSEEGKSFSLKFLLGNNSKAMLELGNGARLSQLHLKLSGQHSNPPTHLVKPNSPHFCSCFCFQPTRPAWLVSWIKPLGSGSEGTWRLGKRERESSLLPSTLPLPEEMRSIFEAVVIDDGSKLSSSSKAVSSSRLEL